jgi:type IV pilus assembly protein PilN
MIRINLLSARKPQAAAAKAKAPKIEVGAGAENLGYAALMILAIGFCLYQWWSLTAEKKRLANEISIAQQELEKVKEGLRIIAELEAKKALIDRKVDIISNLKKARTVPVTLLNELNANLPDFLWFTSMSETANQIGFSGRATTPNAPANLYNNLSASPYFSDVNLNSIAKDANGVNFSLTCTFVPGGKPPRAQG